MSFLLRTSRAAKVAGELYDRAARREESRIRRTVRRIETVVSLDLEDLRVFVRVAALGSFTRAAEQLGASKARASARVAALEAQLGVRLLHRTTRAVRPTADGERLLPRAEQLLASADELVASFQSARNLRGVVRVDAPIVFTRELIVPRLPELLAAHPHLEMQLSSTDRRVDVVREGFDCVLSIGA